MVREREKGWGTQGVRKVMQKISPVLREGFSRQRVTLGLCGSDAHRAKGLSRCWELGIVKAEG